MSTFQQTHTSNDEIGISKDPDFTVPSCTIEDVDRAVFKLFDNDMDLFYKHDGSVVRVPVVFATGERFAILSRNKPLRDANDTLILPLISIARSAIQKNMSRGTATNQAAPITIKRRLSKKDPAYQRIMNKEALQNQDDRANDSHKLGGRGDGTKPGQIATRRSLNETDPAYRSGRLLTQTSNNNIFEIFELPNVRYYTATYEITIWTQYTQQMNDLLMSFMNAPHTGSKITFRIETDKGYYFVAYLDSDLTPGNNFSDFTDSERIVRYTFTISVPAYIINPDYEGARNEIRRFISAPQITFDLTAVYAPLNTTSIVGSPSGNPGDYVYGDLGPENAPLPGQSIAAKSVADVGDYYDTTSVGGAKSGRTTVEVVRTYKDAVTGEIVTEILPFKQRNERKGETVYQAQLTDDLGTISVVPK
jgi:hypothetical protein